MDTPDPLLTSGSILIKIAHIMQLRAAVVVLEGMP